MAPVLAAARLRPRRTLRVGITGPPGAGKSSLVRELVRRIRRKGDRVAVVASDPVSPVTGGAFLGDRCRMAGVADDRDVFIRSLAHRGPTGESSPAAWSAVELIEAAGFDWVLLETVGTGQADVHALRGCDLKLLVHTPDSGDHVQMLKAGLAETAHVHVVGKCDRPGAKAWALELESALRGAEGPAPRVFPVSALTGEGVDELSEVLEAELRGLREEKGGAT